MLDQQRQLDQTLRMNQIQLLGSHNSYKRAIDPSLMSILLEEDPEFAQSVDYSHLSLSEQLNLGLRVLELDIFYDPEGGRYANPHGIQAVREQELPPGPAYDPEKRMLKPGLKVLHVQDVDFRSHCLTFQDALRELRAWSEAHPNHLPLIITMNANDEVVDRPDFVEPLPFDTTAFEALDEEIARALPPGKRITPGIVQGDYPTLEAAVLAHQWPTLADARGRILFVLDEGEEKQRAYLQRSVSSRERLVFMNAPEGSPEAAFRIVNDPINDVATIQRLVRLGYLVRTRADSDTQEARSGETRRAEAAFASGAQCISTDYYVPNPAFGTGYRVRLPGETCARWNPLLAPESDGIPLWE